MNMDTLNQKIRTVELTCSYCGKRYLFRYGEAAHFKARGWSMPIRCPKCRKEKRIEMERREEQRKNLQWQQREAEDKAKFCSLLETWNVVDVESISFDDDNILYILGNGFDIMHGVKSSYSAFRDSLGKNSILRGELEICFTHEDIWADFEAALAKINVELMSDSHILDDWLNNYNAYDEEAGIAEYNTAIDSATMPIAYVAQELPIRFYSWVKKLSIGTKSRPLKQIIRDSKVLCFNYTEFVETMYDVSRENVCYIHGDRRRCKNGREKQLILGHQPGASEEAYNIKHTPADKTKTYRQAMISLAQDNAIDLISEYDSDLTKDSEKIVSEHQDFFESICNTDYIIAIGHSYSEVDWVYYKEIASHLPDRHKVKWIFGCYGLRDLNNLEKLISVLGLHKSEVAILRTDTITVETDTTTIAPPIQTIDKKVLCRSSDDRWKAVAEGYSLSIVNNQDNTVSYGIIFSTFINKAFFTASDKHLFVIIKGADAGVFLFHNNDDGWTFVGELESAQNQSVVNRRLNAVYLYDDKITFVYNNRVREYSLADGELILNKQIMDAKSKRYIGDNAIAKFL